MLAAVLLPACSPGGGDPVTPTPNPTPGSLAVALSSNSGSVVAGSQVTLTTTITRGGSFTGVVTLAAEGAPAGVTASFSASSLAAGVSSAGLTLQVAGSVAAGTYPITVRATGTGVSAATASYALTVTTAAVPTFTLAAAPTTVSVTAGQQGTSTLTITRSGGFTGTVNLTATGAPAGVTASFAPAAVTGGTSTVTLAVAASTTAGTYPITIRGTGTGVTEQTATVTLTVTATATPTLSVAGSATTTSVAQGQASGAITYTLTRGGGLTGNATMALENAPAGVTGTFTPNPATGTTSQLVVNVGGSVAAGTYTLTVRATVGSVSATAPLSLTVTAVSAGDFTIAIAPTTATVTAGNSTNATVSLTRTGGFAGTVNLTATGAPAGVTVAFAPAAATGATSAVTVSVAVGTAAGTYPITIRGNATGLTERTATLTLTVQAGGGGGGGNVTWQFCDTDRIPVFFAFRDGTSGAWTRVLPGAGQTYSFTINDTRGAVTFVIADGGADFDVTTYLLTRTELTAFAQAECTTNPATKTLNGTVAGITPGQTATINVGGGSATATTNGPFTVSNVDDGTVDLIAARSVLDIPTLSTVPDRFILRRNLNLPNNGTIPSLDFGGSEAFAPATATLTIANGGTDMLNITTGFFTSNGASGFFSFGALGGGGGSTRTAYGVPLARTQTGDLHYLQATAVSGTTIVRTVGQYNRELTNRTIALGPVLNAPTIASVATAPYRRLRASGSWQTEYNQGVGATFYQTAGSSRSWSITSSNAYFTGGTFELEIPDLSGVSGFNSTWGLLTGGSVEWSLSASKVENAPIGPFVEGYRFLAGSRTGTQP